MAKEKIEKALYGPSWIEVALGAVLGLILGVLAAGVYLAFKPVKTVREPVKEEERVIGTVYYQPGAQDAAQARNWQVKQKRFLAGGSVEVNESELNAWAAGELKGGAPAAKPATDQPKAKGAEAAKTAAPAEGGKLLSGQAVNFRLVDDRMQFGFKCHVDYFGVGADFTVYAVGRLEKTGGGVEFKADQFYLGSCPLTKLPGAGRFLMGKLLNLHEVSEETKQAWAKVSDARVEGGVLKLTLS